MTRLLLISLLLGALLASMMIHGLHLRRRLPEVTEPTSASPIDFFFRRYLQIPNNVKVLTDTIDKIASNTEAHQLTSVFENVTPEKTDENISLGLDYLRNEMPSESEGKSLIPEQYIPMLDLELFTAAVYTVSDTFVPNDYYQNALNQLTNEEYQEDDTDDYYPDVSPSDYSEAS